MESVQSAVASGTQHKRKHSASRFDWKHHHHHQQQLQILGHYRTREKTERRQRKKLNCQKNEERKENRDHDKRERIRRYRYKGKHTSPDKGLSQCPLSRSGRCSNFLSPPNSLSALGATVVCWSEAWTTGRRTIVPVNPSTHWVLERRGALLQLALSSLGIYVFNIAKQHQQQLFTLTSTIPALPLLLGYLSVISFMHDVTFPSSFLSCHEKLITWLDSDSFAFAGFCGMAQSGGDFYPAADH